MQPAEILTMLQELTLLSVIVRIVLSVVIGGLLGTERGLRNRPAGFMTYVLVCMGSAVIMMTNQYIVGLYPEADAARLGAQVVSGIGFLGAGTIIVTRRDEVRGLTTAAGLWVTAGLGLAVGAGFYTGAIVGCIVAVFALTALKRIDLYIKQHAKFMEIYMEHSTDFSLRDLSEAAERDGYTLSDIQRGSASGLGKELGTLVFSLSFPKRVNHRDVLDQLYKIAGVEYVTEVT